MKGLAISLIGFFFTSHIASAGTLSASVGFSFVNESKVHDPKGFNIKYGYEWDQYPIGIISSFNYLSSSGNNINGDKHRVEKDFDYYSFTLGPTFKINNNFGVYGLIGISRVENKFRVKTTGNDEDVTSFNKNNTVYGFGILFNASENVSISSGIEMSKYNGVDNKKHNFNIYNFNIGYRW